MSSRLYGIVVAIALVALAAFGFWLFDRVLAREIPSCSAFVASMAATVITFGVLILLKPADRRRA